MFKRLICTTLASAAFFAGLPSLAKDPEVRFKSAEALGCMILKECKDGVIQVKSVADLQKVFPDADYSVVGPELTTIFASLNKIGIGVYVGPNKYFPMLTRGIYKTTVNDFFLNRSFVSEPHTLISVIRHEGWHAVQDCMAGTIDNSLVAIVIAEDKVPAMWRTMAERTYPKKVVPWEAEASWAGRVEGMTANGLQACATGKMWEIYEPTPLTRQYLVKHGYIK